MPATAFRSSDGNTIEVSIVIRQPIQSVFEFYRDFRNLPKFLGDVMTIEPTGPDTSRWTIQGPLGIHAHWSVKVTDIRTNELICYETIGAPWRRTSWQIHFTLGSDARETVVRELLRPPLGWLGRAALSMLGKSPAAEVAANLRRMKQVMETACVTDMSLSVPVKFASRVNGLPSIAKSGGEQDGFSTSLKKD